MVQWGRRLATGLVAIPAALWLLASDTGMLVLASALCCLCLTEFSGTIAPLIVSRSASKTSPVHRALVVASGAVACVAAASGQKIVLGMMASLMYNRYACGLIADGAVVNRFGHVRTLRAVPHRPPHPRRRRATVP